MNTVAFGARSRRWWILLVLCLSVLLVVVDNTIVNVAGFATAAGIGTDSAYWGPIIASMTLMAAGLALTSSPATDAIMGALPPAKAGAGSAVNDTTRELGGALGVAVVGSVMASVYRTQVLRSMTSLGAPAAAAAAAKQSVVAGLTVAAHLPPALRGVAAQAARQAFVDGLSAGSVVAAAAAATAATAAVMFLPARARPPRPAGAAARPGKDRRPGADRGRRSAARSRPGHPGDQPSGPCIPVRLEPRHAPANDRRFPRRAPGSSQAEVLMLSAQAAEDRAEALTPVMRNHPPHGRQAHIRPGWTPDAADVRADVTQRRTQFPPEDVIAPDDDTNPARRPNASGPNASRRPPWTSWDSPPWP